MRHVILSALVLAATVSAAPAQTPPAQQADQPQLRFFPITRGTDPVGVIYASPAPGGCLLVFGATARPDNNTAQGGVYVPHGCPRAVRRRRTEALRPPRRGPRRWRQARRWTGRSETRGAGRPPPRPQASRRFAAACLPRSATTS